MGQTPQPRHIDRLLVELARRVADLERGAAGAPIALAGTGSLTAGTTSIGGYPAVLLGPLPTGDVGLELRRQDGTLALRVGASGIGASRTDVGIYDKSGGLIFGDSASVPDGIGRPSLSWPLLPADGADARSTTSGTFVTVFNAVGRKSNAAVELRFWGSCSDGTTAGEVRLVDFSDVPLLDLAGAAQVPTPIPAGTTSPALLVTDPCRIAGEPYDTSLYVRVQVRRTAGAGTVTVRPGVLCGAGG